MRLVWQISLYDTGAARGGFRVKVQSVNIPQEPYLMTMGKGKTPHEAYQNALLQRVVKPWLKSEAS